MKNHIWKRKGPSAMSRVVNLEHIDMHRVLWVETFNSETVRIVFDTQQEVIATRESFLEVKKADESSAGNQIR